VQQGQSTMKNTRSQIMARPAAIRKRGHDNHNSVSNKKVSTTKINAAAVDKENNNTLNKNVVTTTATNINPLSNDNVEEHYAVANHLNKLANVAVTQQESLRNNNMNEMGLQITTTNPSCSTTSNKCSNMEHDEVSTCDDDGEIAISTTNNKCSNMEHDDVFTCDDDGEIAMVNNNNNTYHNIISNEVSGESNNQLYKDYIEHCETIGLSDSLITRAEKARRITRRHGWKDFKLLNDCDFHHTKCFC
jgi:transcriptional regulator with PAS, ATPase and Fis domain